MEEKNSWLRRTKFSQSVYMRVDPRLVPLVPLGKDVELKLWRFSAPAKSVSMPVDRENKDMVVAIKHSDSMPSVRPSLQLDRDNKANKQKRLSLKIPSSPPVNSENYKGPRPKSLVKSPSSMMLLSYLTKAHAIQDSTLQKANSPQHKPRSKSPLPSIVPSDVFREARADGKRFASPPPKQRGSEKSIYGKSFGREVFDMGRIPNCHSTLLVSYKQKTQKESSWARRYFDNGGSRVSAVDSIHDRRGQRASMTQAARTAVDWMLDPSKLLVGNRFACGAYSRLYKGFYDDKPVAIKFIRQPDADENGQMAAKLEKQYNSEINSLSHLYHKNVIKLVAAYKCSPVFYVITEFLSGGSLRSYLHSTEHRIPLEKIISIALNVARGMEYIHSQGVVHRDLKPENILFDENFCVKIADFGIACEEALCDVLVEDAGTYRWMAPEMIKRKAYDRKVDVYSFGLLLWEMVSGRVPYDEMTPVQVAFAVVDKNLRPTLPPECPVSLKALMEECWALQPQKRPDFWQIVKVLEQFESVLAQGGCLDTLKNTTCQDHKKRLLHWIQKLKPSQSTS